VLEAALHSNPHDATAHYLLGTFYFSRGLTGEALDEWGRAREINPKLPVLDASMGMALLRIRRDPGKAEAAFRDGLAADPENLANYAGLDQALSVLAKPASARAAALGRYPDPSRLPTGLIYELILNRSEAGDSEGAMALFRNRFFAREEGGVNVRQVWTEVRLQQALSLAKAGQCDTALPIARQIGSPVAGLDFTRDGMEPFVNAARTQYLLGTVESSCHNTAEADAHFRRTAGARDGADLAWARAAAHKLAGYDEAQWRGRLEAALAQMHSAEASSFSLYATGLIEAALGRKAEAEASFRNALLEPDRLLAWHLARLARAGAVPE